MITLLKPNTNAGHFRVRKSSRSLHQYFNMIETNSTPLPPFCICIDSDMCGCDNQPPYHCMYCCHDLSPEQLEKWDFEKHEWKGTKPCICGLILCEDGSHRLKINPSCLRHTGVIHNQDCYCHNCWWARTHAEI
jgi:hypothetical protein